MHLVAIRGPAQLVANWFLFWLNSYNTIKGCYFICGGMSKFVLKICGGLMETDLVQTTTDMWYVFKSPYYHKLHVIAT